MMILETIIVALGLCAMIAMQIIRYRKDVKRWKTRMDDLDFMSAKQQTKKGKTSKNYTEDKLPF